MSAVPAGTPISSILMARNSTSTLERREKSGIFRRSSTLIITDRSFVSSASYHALRYWYGAAVVCFDAFLTCVYWSGLEGVLSFSFKPCGVATRACDCQPQDRRPRERLLPYPEAR